MPSWSPSISTPGQLRKKKVASPQDVIWEQWVLPSHLNEAERVVWFRDSNEATGSLAPDETVLAAQVGSRPWYFE